MGAKSVRVGLCLLAGALGACGQSGTGSAVHPPFLTSAASAYCPPEITFSSVTIGLCGCAPKEGDHIEFRLWPACSQAGAPVAQDLAIGDLAITVAAAAVEIPDGAGPGHPIVAIGGCRRPPASGAVIRFYGRGATPSTPVSTSPLGELSVPVNEIPVALHQDAPNRWTLATTDDGGSLRAYRMTDTDSDYVPDALATKGNITALLASGGISDVLAAEGVTIEEAQGAPAVTILSQRGRQRAVFEDLDNDTDWDRVLLPARVDPPQAEIVRGAVPGSARVVVSGAVGATLEVWKLGAADAPLVLLASPTISDAGSATALLSQSLVLGDRIRARRASGAWGGIVEIVVGDALSVVALSATSIAVGGTIDIYVPDVGAQTVTAKWVYVDKNNWPEPVEAACSVTPVSSGVLRIAFPSGVSNHFATQQVLEIRSTERPHPDVIDVAVAAP
jgi:hypothetical protein